MARDRMGEEGRGVTAINLGEVSSNLWSQGVRMGKPHAWKQVWSGILNGVGSEPAEVKHFSKRRKRKQLKTFFSARRNFGVEKKDLTIPLVAASEKGSAQSFFSWLIY